jgi:hypothetical protein
MKALRRSAVGETDLVADQAAELALQLLRNAGRVARAAIRRGCVWPIRPVVPRPSSRQIFGICVVLPEPVSPQTMTTWMFGDQRRNLGAPRVDRQIVGELRLRQPFPTRSDRRARALQQTIALGLARIAPGSEKATTIARERTQAALVDRQAVGEGGWRVGLACGRRRERASRSSRHRKPEGMLALPGGTGTPGTRRLEG